MLKWLRGRSAKPLCVGSNPTIGSKKKRKMKKEEKNKTVLTGSADGSRPVLRGGEKEVIFQKLIKKILKGRKTK